MQNALSFRLFLTLCFPTITPAHTQNEAGYEFSFGLFGLFIAVAFSITAFPVLARITELRLHMTAVGVAALSAAAGDVRVSLSSESMEMISKTYFRPNLSLSLPLSVTRGVPLLSRLSLTLPLWSPILASTRVPLSV